MEILTPAGGRRSGRRRPWRAGLLLLRGIRMEPPVSSRAWYVEEEIRVAMGRILSQGCQLSRTPGREPRSCRSVEKSVRPNGSPSRQPRTPGRIRSPWTCRTPTLPGARYSASRRAPPFGAQMSAARLRAQSWPLRGLGADVVMFCPEKLGPLFWREPMVGSAQGPLAIPCKISALCGFHGSMLHLEASSLVRRTGSEKNLHRRKHLI